MEIQAHTYPKFANKKMLVMSGHFIFSPFFKGVIHFSLRNKVKVRFFGFCWYITCNICYNILIREDVKRNMIVCNCFNKIVTRSTRNYMGSSSYLSILYTVMLLLKVWGRTVTRKKGENSDNFCNSSFQSMKRHFQKAMLFHT